MKVTIADIAREAGVSKMTVSRVINKTGAVSGATKEKVDRIIKKMNYYPNHIARSLSSSMTRTIGVVIPKKEKIFMDNYIAHVLSGVSEVLKKEDYRIMLFPVDINNESEVSGLANANLVDGLILLKIAGTDQYIKKLSVNSSIPSIRINNKDEAETINFIDSENIKGAKLAVNYLYNKGHRKIGFITGRLEETNGMDRYVGYKESLNDLNLPYKKEWIIDGDFDKDQAYRNVDKIFELQDMPTAIFASDDYMALGIIEKITEKGYRVPEDFAVIGFDDIDLASIIRPALTTIKQPMHLLGANAAAILLDIIRGTVTPPVKKFLNVELIERETT